MENHYHRLLPYLEASEAQSGWVPPLDVQGGVKVMDESIFDEVKDIEAYILQLLSDPHEGLVVAYEDSEGDKVVVNVVTGEILDILGESREEGIDADAEFCTQLDLEGVEDEDPIFLEIDSDADDSIRSLSDRLQKATDNSLGREHQDDDEDEGMLI